MHSDDFTSQAALPQSTSRRKFMSAAGGTAAVAAAGLVLTATRQAAATPERLVLPAATKDVTPFKVDVPQAALDELKSRLANTRWPDKETVADWSQGVPLAKAQSLVEYLRAPSHCDPPQPPLHDLPHFAPH